MHLKEEGVAAARAEDQHGMGNGGRIEPIVGRRVQLIHCAVGHQCGHVHRPNFPSGRIVSRQPVGSGRGAAVLGGRTGLIEARILLGGADVRVEGAGARTRSVRSSVCDTPAGVMFLGPCGSTP